MPSDRLLEVQGLTKTYDGVHALQGIDLQISEGEVHGLVGENGAGKSTLIKILGGNVVPDSGSVTFNDAPLSFGSVQASADAGISVIHQELVAFLDLDACENIFVGRELYKFGSLYLDKKSMREQAAELLRRLGEAIPLNVPLRNLSVAQRQMVSIARALSVNCRLLVMDEPTASLSNREVEVLMATVERLQAEGVAILYVSHRLDEVTRICDNVSVFRDGKLVERLPRSEATRERMVLAMVGRNVQRTDHQPSNVGNAVLEVKGLTRHGAFREVDLTVHAGEVVCIGGLVGAGRTDVVRAIFGLDAVDRGDVLVEGGSLAGQSVEQRARAGLALVPEDRQHEGLVLPMPVKDNLVLAVRRRLSKAGWIARRQERDTAQELVTKLGVKTASLATPVKALSGGNQQKVVIGKWVATNPKVLILDEPTRGVDVGAKAEVHALIRELAAQGTAVLVVTSDMQELLEVSDRILVMCEGQIAGEIERSTATEERVMALAVSETGRAVS